MGSMFPLALFFALGVAATVAWLVFIHRRAERGYRKPWLGYLSEDVDSGKSMFSGLIRENWINVGELFARQPEPDLERWRFAVLGLWLALFAAFVLVALT